MEIAIKIFLDKPEGKIYGVYEKTIRHDAKEKEIYQDTNRKRKCRQAKEEWLNEKCTVMEIRSITDEEDKFSIYLFKSCIHRQHKLKRKIAKFYSMLDIAKVQCKSQEIVIIIESLYTKVRWKAFISV